MSAYLPRKFRAFSNVLAVCALGAILLAGAGGCKKTPAEKTGLETKAKTEKTVVEPSGPARSEKPVMACRPGDGQDVDDLRRAIRVTFTQRIDPADFSFKINPDPGGWTTTWAEEGRMAVLAHADPFRAGGRYELDLRLKSPAEKVVIRFRAFGPSALDLIDEDAKKGRLDLDAAWTCRLQALFEPDLLPEKYQSRTPIFCGTGTLDDFMAIRNRLRPDTLQTLKPYLVRPTHPESVYSKRMAAGQEPDSAGALPGSGLLFARTPQRPTSTGKWGKSVGPNFTVWYPESDAAAERAAARINEHRMWEKFHDLMQVEPPSDGADADNGGDGTFDIYIVPSKSDWLKKKQGSDSDASGRCRPTGTGVTSASFIMVDLALLGPPGEVPPGDSNFEPVVAHELFHAFQNALKVGAEKWWKESSATWAIHFIEASWNTEHRFDPAAFDADEHRLITLTSTDGNHEYGIYLFPFYAAKKYTASIIGKIWRKCPATDELDAVDQTLPNGLDEAFKEFALMNWDQTQSYEGKIDYPEGVDTNQLHGGVKEVKLPEEVPFDQKIELRPLSARYYRFFNKIKDPEALPHVRFGLKKFTENPKLTVQALIFSSQGGQIKKEDWTGREEREFCLNDENDKFESIVLVLGNAETDIIETPELKVAADQEGCLTSYVDLTRKEHYFSHEWGTNYDSQTTRDEEATVRVFFDDPQISRNLGGAGEKIGMPYGFTLVQGKSPRVISSVLKKHSVIVDRDKKRTHDATGSAPEIQLPDVPTLTGTLDDNKPFSIQPYPVIIMYYDSTNGKVKYCLPPEIQVIFQWSDSTGGKSYFTVKPLPKGDSREKVDVAGVTIGRLQLRKIHEVTTGDGVTNFGSEGHYKSENKGARSYSLQEMTYKWEAYVKPQKKKQ